MLGYNVRMSETHEHPSHWGIVGHDWAVDFLQRSLLNGRQRHAFLITGVASLGKMTLARAFAMALNCELPDAGMRPCRACRACQAINRSHDPDLILVASEDGAPLKIDDIRNVTRLLALKPYAARYRIAIFQDFELVAPQAQDALLKTLEEPAPYAILILLASSAERILPTIRSRSQIIPLRPVPQQLIKASLLDRGCAADKADLIARLSSGRLGWALSVAEDEAGLSFRAEMLDLLHEILTGPRLARLKASEKLSLRIGRDKALLRTILETWQSWWRDVMLQCCDSPVKPCNSDRHDEISALASRLDSATAYAALKATQSLMQSLQTNANIRLALDALVLDYPGLD